MTRLPTSPLALLWLAELPEAQCVAYGCGDAVVFQGVKVGGERGGWRAGRGDERCEWPAPDASVSAFAGRHRTRRRPARADRHR